MAFKRDDEGWEQKLKELEVYKKEHGDCNVPARYAPNPPLGRWVTSQRKLLKKGQLPDDRKRRLEEARFVNSAHDKNWEQKFKELQKYKLKHGHCNVPRSNLSLGIWVKTQRRFRKEGRLSDDQKRRLEEAGFAFGPVQKVWDEVWDVQFRAAKKYKDKHGRWPRRGNPEFGEWVSKQRMRYRKGTLEGERIDRLNNEGFPWDGRRYPSSVPGGDGVAVADTANETASGTKLTDSAVEGEGGSADEIAPSAARRTLRGAEGDDDGISASRLSKRKKASKARAERAKKRWKFREEKARAKDHASEDAADESIADPHIGWQGESAGEGRHGTEVGVSRGAYRQMRKKNGMLVGTIGVF